MGVADPTSSAAAGAATGSVIPGVGTLGGAAIGLGSSLASSAFNAWQQSKTNQQQIDLSNTAHQREVADLKAAGLNPILSARYGGSSTPSFQAPSLADPTSSMASGVSSAKGSSLIEAQTRKTNAEAASAETQAQVNIATKIWTEQQIKNVSDKSLAELGSAQNQELISRQERDFANATIQDRITMYKNLEPKSDAERNMYKTWFGKYIAPYVHSAGQAVDIIRP